MSNSRLIHNTITPSVDILIGCSYLAVVILKNFEELVRLDTVISLSNLVDFE